MTVNNDSGNITLAWVTRVTRLSQRAYIHEHAICTLQPSGALPKNVLGGTQGVELLFHMLKEVNYQ